MFPCHSEGLGCLFFADICCLVFKVGPAAFLYQIHFSTGLDLKTKNPFALKQFMQS